jgi:hypothetical protein
MRGSPSGRFVAAAIISVALIAGCGVSSDVSRSLGAVCEDEGECEDRCLTGGRYPDGFCSLSCNGDGDCPDGAACVDREGGVCLFTCSDRADCQFLGAEWRCRSQPEGGDGNGQVMVCTGPG